jgi:ERCC4-type nuclease
VCRDAASKTTSTHVAYLRQAGIPVLYSCDKADTVRLLAMLTDLECSQNRGIIPLPKDVATVVNHIQFYQSLPGVNIALAMRLCHIFSSVIDFLDRCSNVQKIQEVLGLDAEKAVRIQLVLHHVIKPQC